MNDDDKRNKPPIGTNRAYPRRKTDPRRRTTGLHGLDRAGQPSFYSIREFCRTSSLGRTSAHELIRTGEVKCHKIGRRVLIPKWAAIGYLMSLPRLKPSRKAPPLKKKG